MGPVKKMSGWRSHKSWVAALVLVAALAPGAWVRGQVVPPFGLEPLNQIHVPQPTNVFEYITNEAVLIQLGKALFWDMQVGSDGLTACATCHFKAGADPRRWNSLNPGTRAVDPVTFAPAPDTVFGNNTIGVPGYPQFGPNYHLQDGDFPFHRRAAPRDVPLLPIVADTNDVVGSQGVRLSRFLRPRPEDRVFPVDATVPEPDPVFHINGTNTRRVTGRNAPTVINAVFNFAQFHDGRAHFLFNGENPFGPLGQDLNANGVFDPEVDAGVWFNELGGLVKRPVSIRFASLASQAVGPPVDDIEMSAVGRTFPDIGHKLLNLRPLDRQLVHPGDSLLGDLSAATLLPDGRLTGLKGLNVDYATLIRNCFHDILWNSPQRTPGTPDAPEGYTQMEANFAFFFGLAIQYYEATLVSDQSPFDHWLGGDPAAMSLEQQHGLELFFGIGNCSVCHIGTEFTTASHTNVAFISNGVNATIELMFASDGHQVVYDDGFINSSVTLTAEDLGRGALTELINPVTGQPLPLSFSELAVLQARGLLPFETPLLPFFPDFPAMLTMPAATRGAFKVPGLRNVALTGPYFHNGSVLTLDDTIDFYSRGGNFPRENIADLDPVIGQGLHLISGDHSKHLALRAFLEALTDPRVAAESAPFDHPEIFIPEGEPEFLIRIAATDTTGAPAPDPTLMLNAVTSPTVLGSQVVSGTVQAGLTPQVTVALPAVAGPVTVVGTSWSVSISGLAEGPNPVNVSVFDGAVVTTVSATIVVDTVPPALTLDPVTTPTRSLSQALTGTVERGVTPVVTVDPPATASATLMIDNTTWSCQVFNLQEGINAITVSATDVAGNATELLVDVSLDTIPPSLAVSPVSSPTGYTAQQIFGAVEAGIIPVVTAGPLVDVGDVTISGVDGTSWSVPLANLQPGANMITVTAADAAGNVAAREVVISVEIGIYGKAASLGGPLAGVMVTATGPATATAICDAAGNFRFTGLPNGTYTLTPSLPGFAFTPATLTAVLAGGAVLDRNFVGVPVGIATVSGVVRDRNRSPLRGVTLRLSGPTTMTVRTNLRGKFAFKGVVNGTYTLTASRAGFAFKPASRTLLIQGGNFAGQNFTGRKAGSLRASR